MRLFIILCAAALILCGVWPDLDIRASAFFYRPDGGFTWANNIVLDGLHNGTVVGSSLLGLLLLVAAIIGFLSRRDVLRLPAKAWVFLFLGLVIGPGLIANVGFKDHWGRARPREIVEFGGTHPFTPFYAPQPNPHTNQSFVAGDPAFGFYLPAFGFAAPRPKRKMIFYSGISIGILLGAMRIMMGGHFLSDVAAAALLMLASIVLLYRIMYRHWPMLNTTESE